MTREELAEISQLASALYFAKARADIALIKAYLLDFKPPQQVKRDYYNLVRDLNDKNYPKKVEKVVDLLANLE